MASVHPAVAERVVPAWRIVYRHSLIVRVCHWINALCFLILLMSGLQIFNANPQLNFGYATDFKHPFFSLSSRQDGDNLIGVTNLFGRSFDTTGWLGASNGADAEMEDRGFPAWATLPSEQDLATGRRWHFFFAWILVINGLFYVANLTARRHIRDLIPTAADLRAIPHTVAEHLKLRFPKGDAALAYNVLQKLAYLSVVVAFPILILAGLTVSPAIDSAFPWLVPLFGGRQSARAVHFLIASYLVLFVLVHLIMVLVSGVFNNLRSMITGRYRIEEETP